MPIGLDGNPNPIASPARDRVLAHVADLVEAVQSERVLVAIDGRSGVGKSTFADELAHRLAERGRHVIRSTTDAFHRPRAERLRRGATSAVGYVEDSHQLGVIVSELLRPFGAGADTVLTSAFDEPSDSAHRTTTPVESSAVLIFDGLFLHRSEFESFWDLSVLLTADRRLDAAWLDFLLSGLPGRPVERAARLDERLKRARWPRYRDGWARYVELARPAQRADVVVDNDDLHSPDVRRPQ